MGPSSERSSMDRKRKAAATSAMPGVATGPGAFARLLAGEDGLGQTCLPPLAPTRQAGGGGCRQVARPVRTEPLPPGLARQMLPDFVARAAASVPRRSWEALGRNLGGQASAPVRITFGTACSGSEFYLTGLPLLAGEMSQRLGRDVRFEHLWSCELDPAKRQWIMDNFAPPKLFGDITRLAEGRCHDFVSGGLVEVEKVRLVIAGTSCKDASRLNNQHGRRLNVVDAGAHSTGETFCGLVRLLASAGTRCRLVCLENVPSLRDRDPQTGRSNFDGVADAVRSLGFSFVSAVFSAEHLGLPVSRPRLYMSGVRGARESAAQKMADDVLTAIRAGAADVPMDSLLLPETEPHLMMRDWMPEGLARSREQPCDVAEGVWQQQHRTSWRGIPPAVRALIAPRFAANPWFRILSPRQRDLLLLASCHHHMARRATVAIPLHVSLGWETPSHPARLPTLVPRGVYWLVSRQRPLLGVEAIRLQGCDPSSLPGLRPEMHTSAFLHDLAGNAFCVYQFCVWLLASLVAGEIGDPGRDGERAESE